MSEMLASPEQNTNSYTAQDITSLMINSFRFSRGGSQLQRGFLSFIADSYPDRFDDPAIFDEALPRAQEAAFSIYQRTHFPADDESADRHYHRATSEVKVFMRSFQQFVEDGDAAPYYTPLSEFAATLVTTDFNRKDKLRKEGKAPFRESSPTYSSNLVTHGFLGRPTGRKEFDAAFGAVTEIVLNSPERLFYEDPAAGAAQIRSSIEAHLANHPEDSKPLQDVISGTALETFLQAPVDIA